MVATGLAAFDGRAQCGLSYLRILPPLRFFQCPSSSELLLCILRVCTLTVHSPRHAPCLCAQPNQPNQPNLASPTRPCCAAVLLTVCLPPSHPVLILGPPPPLFMNHQPALPPLAFFFYTSGIENTNMPRRVLCDALSPLLPHPPTAY